MSELQYTFAYIILGFLLFGLVCAVVAVVFANRRPIDSSKSGAPEGNWRGK